jgi:predicted transcriptional regulator
MSKNKSNLTIIVGGDMDADIERLFSENCDLDKEPRHVFYLNSFEELHDLLSPKRMDLLKWLIEYKPNSCNSVSDLAKKLNRKQEAISRDLKQLRKLGLIVEKKEKQSVLVSVPFKKLVIEVQ